jgi:hypothetical protein
MPITWLRVRGDLTCTQLTTGGICDAIEIGFDSRGAPAAMYFSMFRNVILQQMILHRYRE